MHLLDTPAAGRYRVIYADPNWHFATHSAKGQGKSASQHYTTQTVEEMIAEALPVSRVAAADAHLFLWTTWPHLQTAFRLVDSWSDPLRPWDYKTGGTWAKRPRGWRGDPSKWAFGTGYIFRSASEVLLVFTRGNPTWRSKSERNLWVAPLREHSRKPEEVRDMIRRATDGPRLEMFAREQTDGFDVWGRERHKFNG